eukprot:1188452-Prorocentrum_minimum.AAC.8
MQKHSGNGTYRAGRSATTKHARNLWSITFHVMDTFLQAHLHGFKGSEAFAVRDWFENGDGSTFRDDDVVILTDADMIMMQSFDNPTIPDAEIIRRHLTPHWSELPTISPSGPSQLITGNRPSEVKVSSSRMEEATLGLDSVPLGASGRLACIAASRSRPGYHAAPVIGAGGRIEFS